MSLNTYTPDKEFFSKKINRFIGASLLGFIAFANTDRGLGELYWRDNNTEINLFSFSEKEKNINNLWVIFPGLGVQNGEGIAASLDTTLSKTGDIAYAKYDDNGTEFDVLARELIDVLDSYDYETVSFYAHSMGSAIMINVINYLKDKGINIKIEAILLDCSPGTVYDAKSVIAPVASSLVPPYRGGFITKLGSEIYNNVFGHPNDRLNKLEQVGDGVRIATTGSSPMLFTNQLDTLGEVSAQVNINVGKDTKVYYIHPDSPDNDETVDTTKAFRYWNDYFGGNLKSITVYGGGHANPSDRPGEYNQALAKELIPQKIKPFAGLLKLF